MNDWLTDLLEAASPGDWLAHMSEHDVPVVAFGDDAIPAEFNYWFGSKIEENKQRAIARALLASYAPQFAAGYKEALDALEGMCEMSGHGAECDSWEEFESEGAMIRHPERPCTCPKAAAEAVLANAAKLRDSARVVE